MYKKLILWMFGVFFLSSAFAGSATNYIQLTLPSAEQLGISYPVYVYQYIGNEWKQINYVTNVGKTYQFPILGKTNQGIDSIKYKLYAEIGKDSGTWKNCEIIIKNGGIDPETTCAGAVLIPHPTGPSSNIDSLGIEGTPNAMQPSSPPKTFIAPVFQKDRTVKFTNNTNYAEIQVSQRCTVAANPNNDNCQNRILFNIKKNESDIFTLPEPYGLISNSFIMTAFKDKITDKNWTPTGGYGAGKQPYALKIEPTWLSSTPTGVEQTNIDASIVDGVNIGYKIYPSSSNVYCTWVKPETTTLMAGTFNQSNPMAEVNLRSDDSSLEKICKDSPVDFGSGSQSLVIKNNNEYAGCMSPCRKAVSLYGKDAVISQKYCCSGSYNTGDLCRAAGLANNSSYVKNFHLNTTHTYTYAYDDTVGDYSCDGLTNFVVSYTS